MKKFEPLKFADDKVTKRYSKLAKRTKVSPIAAIKLKCIECCGWEFKEARACEINTCPLWQMNRRAFKVPKEEDETVQQ